MEIDANFDLALVRTNPLYFAACSRYIFPTTCGKRTYKFARINEQTKYAVEGVENREMGLRRVANKVSCMSYLHSDLVADQRYHKIRPTCANVRAEMNDFSDEWKSTFSAMELPPSQPTRPKYRSAVRDKNRWYEEYRWRPVECSCQYLNDTATRPLVDSMLMRIQCGSRCEITFRIALSFDRTIQLINL